MDGLELAALWRARTALDHLTEEGVDATPARKAAAFVELARCLFCVKDPNDFQAALKFSKNELLHTRAAAHLTTDTVWANADIQDLAEHFVASIAGGSLLEAIKAGATVLPKTFQHVLIASGVTTDVTAEGGLKIVRQLSLSRNEEAITKITGIVALSQELARAGGEPLRRMFESEFRRSLLKGVNAAILDALVDSNATAVVGTGDPVADLRLALGAAGPSDAYVIAASPGVVAALALSDMNHAGMGVGGGQFIGGIHVVPVTSEDYMVVIGSSRIAVADFGVSLRASNLADLNMSDSPSAPSTLVSLWQTNSTALRAEQLYQLEPNGAPVVVVTPSV